MSDTEDRLITHHLNSISGGGESTRIFIMVDTQNPENSEVIVERQIRKRMPITKTSEAKKLFEQLTRSGGRVVDLEDLL